MNGRASAIWNEFPPLMRHKRLMDPECRFHEPLRISLLSTGQEPVNVDSG